MENDIMQIYESAIGEMKKEILRLEICVKYQGLMKKLEKRKTKINCLVGSISDKQNKIKNGSSTLAKDKNAEYFSVDNIRLSLKSQIKNLTQKIFREKLKKNKEYNYYEKILKLSNSNLYMLIMKLNESSQINYALKSKLEAIQDYHKYLVYQYSKITQILKSVLGQREKQEKIDTLENLNKIKAQRINTLELAIQKHRIPNPDPKVTKIFAKYRENQQSIKDFLVYKSNLKAQLKNTDEEIDFTIKYPEDIPLVTANKNIRLEIKKLEQEISSKSKNAKELEHIKLSMELSYSNLLQKRSGIANYRPMKKSSSTCNTRSNTLIDRASKNSTSLRQSHSRNTDRESKRSSVDIVRIISTNKNCLNKNALIALSSLAPGKRITDKILAFNRRFNSP